MSRILVTGATGFLGKRLCRALAARGEDFAATSLSLGTDLRDPDATLALFRTVSPEVVLHCAAFVGGIQFGLKYPADVFAHNLRISLNLYDAARDTGVRRIVNPFSSCVYPARATYFREDEWWDGPLDPSVVAYGLARKASWVGSCAYGQQYGLDVFTVILSNMYGPEDHFDDERSHALGALVERFTSAAQRGDREVVVWGTGTPVREWLFVDDGVEAMLRAADAASTTDPVNVGVGKGVSIIELARMIGAEVGFRGAIRLDPTKPDGAPFKTVDGSRGERLLGWRPRVELADGIRDTVEWYRAHRDALDPV